MGTQHGILIFKGSDGNPGDLIAYGESKDVRFLRATRPIWRPQDGVVDARYLDGL